MIGFPSHDKEGDHIIKSATVENLFPTDANIAKQCAVELQLLTTEVLNAVQGHSKVIRLRY